MFYFDDSLRSLLLSMRNVFRRPTTVEYPKVERPRAPRFRTSFALRHGEDGDELCIGCKACERICPSQVITVEAEKRPSPVSGEKRAYARVFTLDLNACIFCELCVQVCPADAIVMTRVPEQPQYSRQGLCLDRERLYQNQRAFPLSWATGSRLAQMQGPRAPASKPKTDGSSPNEEAKPEVTDD